jgi:glycosyltransferase involved in cell wall biosynthesis
VSLDIMFVGLLPPHRGGGGISCGELVGGLARCGHRVRALAPIAEEAWLMGDAFAATHPDVEVRRFRVPPYTIDPTITPPDEYRRLEHREIVATVRAMIADARPDVILIGRGTFALDVPDIARTHRIPVVLRSAGSTALGMLGGLLPGPLSQQMLNQYRHLDLIVCPATHLAERLRQVGLRKVKVIPNAIDLRRFSPQPRNEALLRKLGISSDMPIILHASNLKPFKRPLDLVTAARNVLSHGAKMTFVIVGDGPLRSVMEEAARNQGVVEHFHFVGWVEYDEMPVYINLADIVVMPSEGEGLSRVYLETMACGRTLVASDIPAAREVIIDGETGVLFRKGEVDELAVKLRAIAAQPESRVEMGRRAEARARGHSLERALADYTATLADLIRSHSAGSKSGAPNSDYRASFAPRSSG